MLRFIKSYCTNRFKAPNTHYSVYINRNLFAVFLLYIYTCLFCFSLTDLVSYGYFATMRDEQTRWSTDASMVHYDLCTGSIRTTTITLSCIHTNNHWGCHRSSQQSVICKMHCKLQFRVNQQTRPLQSISYVLKWSQQRPHSDDILVSPIFTKE